MPAEHSHSRPPKLSSSRQSADLAAERRNLVATSVWGRSLLKDRFWKYDAIAIRQSRVACLPKAEFMRLLETSIPFNRFLLEQLNERLGHFIGLIEFDRLLDPDARVARCIASLFNPRLYPGVRTSLALSQEEIRRRALTTGPITAR